MSGNIKNLQQRVLSANFAPSQATKREHAVPFSSSFLKNRSGANIGNSYRVTDELIAARQAMGVRCFCGCSQSVHLEPIIVDTTELIGYLEQFVSEKRKKRFEHVLLNRMRHMCVVLENVFQPHNASAVLRSCDCFGVQHVHFIENRNSLRISEEVAMGSSSWLNIHRHKAAENNTTAALQELKKQGYRIVVTSPHKNGYTPETLPVDSKFALVFGTELDGLTQEALDLADDFLTVPMFGFTESFNISVCAALCMYELTKRIRADVPGWQIDEPERSEIQLSWFKASIDHSEAIIADYLNKKKV